MNSRRVKIENAISRLFPGRDIRSLAIATFPTLGSGDWLASDAQPDPEHAPSRSIFLPMQFTNPHPRFGTLMSNIRQRRKAKVAILIPLWKDTESGKGEAWSHSMERNEVDRFKIEELSKITVNPVKDMIYMDAMGFGMGLSCLQVTFLATNVKEARRLTDQFAVLAPLFLPLTAASPFLRGLVSAKDSRWDVIAQSVDCRTVDEQFGENSDYKKSRYGSISLYIDNDDDSPDLLHKLNDIKAPNNVFAEEAVLKAGLDATIARHVGFLFSRDPLVIYSHKIDSVNDLIASDHFENLQSTNWNSVRFKPPPPSVDGVNGNPKIGWRVEFRTPELQLTDFENSAVAGVLLLFVDALRAHPEWDFRGFMSWNEHNMEVGQLANVASEQKDLFRVRRNICRSKTADVGNELAIVSLGGFFNGDAKQGVPGLFNLLRTHLDNCVAANSISSPVAIRLSSYLTFLSMRASGQLLTNAAFFRNFLATHPSYKQDSVVPEDAAAELLDLGDKISRGLVVAPELLGTFPAYSGLSKEFLSQSRTYFLRGTPVAMINKFCESPVIVNTPLCRNRMCPSRNSTSSTPIYVDDVVTPVRKFKNASNLAYQQVEDTATTTGLSGPVASGHTLHLNDENKRNIHYTHNVDTDLDHDCPWCGRDHIDETVPPVQLKE